MTSEPPVKPERRYKPDELITADGFILFRFAKDADKEKVHDAMRAASDGAITADNAERYVRELELGSGNDTLFKAGNASPAISRGELNRIFNELAERFSLNNLQTITFQTADFTP